jgi:acyl-coenzyme A synthetase/AMP-(fatty) acid ligase
MGTVRRESTGVGRFLTQRADEGQRPAAPVLHVWNDLEAETRHAYASELSRRAPLDARRLEFSDLPKTISGKIRRGELRASEEKRRQSGEHGPLEFFEEEL